MVTEEFQEKGKERKKKIYTVVVMQVIPTQEVLHLLNHIELLITSEHCQRCYLMLS